MIFKTVGGSAQPLKTLNKTPSGTSSGTPGGTPGPSDKLAPAKTRTLRTLQTLQALGGKSAALFTDDSSSDSGSESSESSESDADEHSYKITVPQQHFSQLVPIIHEYLPGVPLQKEGDAYVVFVDSMTLFENIFQGVQDTGLQLMFKDDTDDLEAYTVESVQPEEPVEPEEPEQPVESVQPAPVEPVEPEQPEQPVQPAPSAPAPNFSLSELPKEALAKLEDSPTKKRKRTTKSGKSTKPTGKSTKPTAKRRKGFRKGFRKGLRFKCPNRAAFQAVKHSVTRLQKAGVNTTMQNLLAAGVMPMSKQWRLHVLRKFARRVKTKVQERARRAQELQERQAVNEAQQKVAFQKTFASLTFEQMQALMGHMQAN